MAPSLLFCFVPNLQQMPRAINLLQMTYQNPALRLLLECLQQKVLNLLPISDLTYDFSARLSFNLQLVNRGGERGVCYKIYWMPTLRPVGRGVYC